MLFSQKGVARDCFRNWRHGRQLLVRRKSDETQMQLIFTCVCVKMRVGAQIYEMAAVMQKAVQLDEEAYETHREYVSSLESENSGLRDLLMITNGPLGAQFTSKTRSNSETTISPNCSTMTVEVAESADSDSSQALAMSER